MGSRDFCSLNTPVRALGIYSLMVFSLLFLATCKKAPPPVPPAAAAPPVAETRVDIPAPAPSLEISASPSTVERGQQSTLSWTSRQATSVLIDEGVGNVATSGSIVISPRQSVTFTATATGPGGEARASTRVTVVEAALSEVIRSTDIDSLERAIVEGKVRDIFFDYDKSDLTPEARRVLQENARWFRQFPQAGVVIEGHCDERGTEEYNLALGDRRAQAARAYLVQLGVEAHQLESISYGEERPFDPGHDEAAWAKNRRAHFTVKR